MNPNEALAHYQEPKPIVVPRQFGVEVIMPNGKRHNLTHDQYAQVQAALVPQQPAPIYIYPQQSPQVDPQLQADRRWLRFATGAAIVASGVVVAAIVKSAFFPTPVAPVASQQPIQPVVIVPPTPAPQPYTSQHCESAGFLGMNTVCQTERGYR